MLLKFQMKTDQTTDMPTCHRTSQIQKKAVPVYLVKTTLCFITLVLKTNDCVIIHCAYAKNATNLGYKGMCYYPHLSSNAYACQLLVANPSIYFNIWLCSFVLMYF